MNRIIFSAAAVLSIGMAAPANACITAQQQVTIHPVMEIKPQQGDGALGRVFKVRYDGERSGEINKLWPNFYVVTVIEGEMKGEKVAIPAHVTSCHSVHIAKGAQGYVVGGLKRKDRDGNKLDVPILSTWMNGRKERFQLPQNIASEE